MALLHPWGSVMAPTIRRATTARPDDRLACSST
jgi:hypothetical protein